MNYHTPCITKPAQRIDFLTRNKELVVPQNVLTKEEYPTLKESLVKIVAQNGKNIFVPLRKLGTVSLMDV